MKNNLFIIITGFIVLVLVSICLVTMSAKPTYSKLSYNEFEKLDTGLVYFGELDSDVKKVLKDYDRNYSIKEYIVQEFDIDSLNKLLNDNKLTKIEEQGFVFINNSVPVWSGNKSFEEKSLNEEINYQINGTLRSSDIVYNIPTKIDDMVNLINRNKYTVTVLSKSDCSYCTLYQPVINNIVKKYGVDLYYLDKDNFTEKEFDKFKNLDLEIKAECTTTDTATTTKGILSYPLVLITKKGKSVDCLLGYQSESEVLELLSKYNIIK